MPSLLQVRFLVAFVVFSTAALVHARDENAPHFRAINGHFCPRLQLTPTHHPAIYTVTRDHSLAIVPDCRRNPSAFMPHIVMTWQCDPSLSDSSLHPWPSSFPQARSMLFLSWNSHHSRPHAVSIWGGRKLGANDSILQRK
jgi:hypothetical protein